LSLLVETEKSSVPSLTEFLLQGTPVPEHRPWPRRRVPREQWLAAIKHLADGHWTLAGLWADPRAVHMAVSESVSGERGALIAVLSHDCEDGGFPSVARSFPPANRLERAIRDLYGHEPEGAPDARPWLDHGRWGVRAPLGGNPVTGEAAGAYRFLPAEGENLHQIAVGPVHAGIIEPGHFRFTASGETVVRLEERLGYVHKGTEALLRGADLGRAAQLAGRVSGDSTVAYAWAFARAVEAATGVEVPERAVRLRALMAELERLANHLGDIGAICNDAAFTLMHAHCAVLREEVLRACAACFGHRLMMDRVVPGGVNADLDAPGAERLAALVRKIRPSFAELVALYDNTPSLLERTTNTGFLKPELARLYGCGGYIGRASGRAFDARKHPGYAPYDRLRFDVPVLEDGDVNARVWVRIREVEQSLSLIEQILEQGSFGTAAVPPVEPRWTQPVEGAALVEGFRGDILVWVRLGGDGKIERCHLRDPSWFQWPLLEAAIEGNIVADFPLCNKSFNCSYSGHDL
jgi:Ni,Fe-hydrogenase III large subunit